MPNRGLNLWRQLSESVDDAVMLRRFVGNRDATAFEMLVWRHGPSILSTCRRMLRDAHLAEDALQATFLVLSQKAETIRKGTSLAGWLHRTACRICWEAKKQPRPESLNHDPPIWQTSSLEPDMAAIIDAEVDRLPERYRQVVILCYLQGESTANAAKQLSIPRGTVLSRLAKARIKLSARLAKRGLAPVLGIALFQDSLSATLVQHCVTLDCHSATTVPVQLAKGVMEMSLRKLALAWSIVLVSVAGVGTSISIVAGGDSDEPGTIVQDAPSSQTKTSLIEQIALEHEALHGTWELVEIQVDGVPEKRSSWDDGTRSWTKIRFADGVATNLGEGGGTKEYICYPNPTTQPKQINEFSHTYLLQGIYKIEGTTLTMAYHRIKEIRPTSFDHTKSVGRPSPLQTLIYKRIKDEPPAPSPKDVTLRTEDMTEKVMERNEVIKNAPAEKVAPRPAIETAAKPTLSEIEMTSKKAALLTVEQELVKAEVKQIKAKTFNRMYGNSIQLNATADVVANYAAAEEVVRYLKQRRAELQKELGTDAKD